MGTEVDSKSNSSQSYLKHPEVSIPGYIGRSITSFLVFIMAATMRGKSFFDLLVRGQAISNTITLS